MIKVEIKIDTAKFNAAAVKLSPERVNSYVASTIKRVASSGRVKYHREIMRKYAFKSETVRSAMNVSRIQRGDAVGYRISIAKRKTRFVKDLPAVQLKRQGVRVTVIRGKPVYLNKTNFIQSVGNLRTVWHRQTKKRLPIAVTAPFTVYNAATNLTIYKDVERDIMQKASEQVDKLLTRLLR